MEFLTFTDAVVVYLLLLYKNL